MTSSYKKELHLALNLEELNSFLKTTVNTKNTKLLISSANKLFKNAEEQALLGDEESAYVYYMRYITLITDIKKTSEFRKNKSYYDKLLGSKNAVSAITRAEKLSVSLKERYDYQEAQSLSKRLEERDDTEMMNGITDDDIESMVDSLSVESSEVIDKKTTTSEKEFKKISADRLYHLILSNTDMIILDLRQSTIFDESYIKFHSVANIPPEVLRPGSICSNIDNALSTSARSVFVRRYSVEYIIVVEQVDLMKGETESESLRVLLDAMFKWELSSKPKHKPYVLEGGFEDFALHYPTYITRPVSIFTDKSAALNSSLDFKYPDVTSLEPPVIKSSSKNSGDSATLLSGDSNVAPGDQQNTVQSSSGQNVVVVERKSSPMRTKHGIPVFDRLAKPSSRSPKTIRSSSQKVITPTTVESIEDSSFVNKKTTNVADVAILPSQPEKDSKIDRVKPSEMVSDNRTLTKPTVEMQNDGPPLIPSRDIKRRRRVVQPSPRPSDANETRDSPISSGDEDLHLPKGRVAATRLASSKKLSPPNVSPNHDVIIKPSNEGGDYHHSYGNVNQSSSQNIIQPTTAEELVSPKLDSRKVRMLPDGPDENVKNNFSLATHHHFNIGDGGDDDDGNGEKSSTLKAATVAASKIRHKDDDNDNDVSTKAKISRPPRTLSTTNLPPGWERRLHESSGRYFYIDHTNKRTQWHSPLIDMANQQWGTSQSPMMRGKQPSHRAVTAVSKSSRNTSVNDNQSGNILYRANSTPNIAELTEKVNGPTSVINESQIPSVPRNLKPSAQTKTYRSMKSNFNEDEALSKLPPEFGVYVARVRQFNPTYGGQGPGTTGLRSLQNTCFMNSVLQALSHCMPFAFYFISKWYLKYIKDDESSRVAVEFYHINFGMWIHAYKSITPSEFRNACARKTYLMDGRQQDAAEFLTFLLDCLNEGLNRVVKYPEALPEAKLDEWNKLPDAQYAELAWKRHLLYEDSIVTHLFQGQHRSWTTCKICGYLRKGFDAFSYITLPIPSKRERLSLQDCLDAYVERELCDTPGANYWRCENCNKRVPNFKKLDFWKLPKFFIITFKRFEAKKLPQGNYIFNKVTTYIDYPVNQFDLGSYVKGPDRGAPYDLCAVISHVGATVSSGHYTAYCKVLSSFHPERHQTTWRLFDDAEVTVVKESKVHTANAYILFYVRNDVPAVDIDF